MNLQEDIKNKIIAALERLNLELYDIKYMPSGANSVLRIYIDKENGVTIADCEAASNELSVLLDVEDFSKSPYRLEVSSPGADRILRSERDFKRIKGKTIRAEIRNTDGKQKTVTGKVVDCDSTMIRLEIKGQITEIPLSNIEYAKIELTFK